MDWEKYTDHRKSTHHNFFSEDGVEILSDKKEILNRFAEHNKIPNVYSDIEYEALNEIKQRPVISALDIKPSIDETLKAIKETKKGKSPGICGIPAEIWNHGGEKVKKKPYSRLERCQY